jgi:hypothetical protein
MPIFRSHVKQAIKSTKIGDWPNLAYASAQNAAMLEAMA